MVSPSPTSSGGPHIFISPGVGAPGHHTLSVICKEFPVSLAPHEESNSTESIFKSLLYKASVSDSFFMEQDGQELCKSMPEKPGNSSRNPFVSYAMIAYSPGDNTASPCAGVIVCFVPSFSVCFQFSRSALVVSSLKISIHSRPLSAPIGS